MLYLFLVAKMEAMPKFTLFARLFFICFCFEVITMESMFKVRNDSVSFFLQWDLSFCLILLMFSALLNLLFRCWFCHNFNRISL